MSDPPVGRDPWVEPSASQRSAILRRTRTVAVLGASADPSRASNFVLTYLLSSLTNYAVWPVNPNVKEILGQTVYPSLSDLPEVPDLVDVFRRPDDLVDVAQETAKIGADTLWLQSGLFSLEAATIAHDKGLDVVMNRCLKIEHARFARGITSRGL